MLGCWLPSGLEDAGVSKATNCSRRSTATAALQIRRTAGSLLTELDTENQGHKARKFPWVKSLKLCQAAQRRPVFSIFSDIVFIGNQSRLETHMSFKDCGTSLWNHFGQLSSITKYHKTPGCLFLGCLRCCIAAWL